MFIARESLKARDADLDENIHNLNARFLRQVKFIIMIFIH